MFQDIIRSEFVKKTKKRQDLSLPSECFVSWECQRGWKISRKPSLSKGHRGQSRQNQGTSRNARSTFCERCAEIDRKSGRAQQVHS
jgi:hypothetical protein